MTKTNAKTAKKKIKCEDCKIDLIVHGMEKRCKECQEKYRLYKKSVYLYKRKCTDCGGNFKSKNGRVKRCDNCKVNGVCIICSKDFKRAKQSQTKLTCSTQCSNFSKADHYYGGNYSKVMFRDNLKCRRCESAKRTTAHHIDYTGNRLKHNEANNEVNNLITLCDSCHQQLHALTNRTLVNNHFDEAKEILNRFIGE